MQSLLSKLEAAALSNDMFLHEYYLHYRPSPIHKC